MWNCKLTLKFRANLSLMISKATLAYYRKLMLFEIEVLEIKATWINAANLVKNVFRVKVTNANVAFQNAVINERDLDREIVLVEASWRYPVPKRTEGVKRRNLVTSRVLYSFTVTAHFHTDNDKLLFVRCQKCQKCIANIFSKKTCFLSSFYSDLLPFWNWTFKNFGKIR